MQIIDSHCHINFPELGEDIEGILKRMEENSVTKALCVSVQLEKLDEILDSSDEVSKYLRFCRSTSRQRELRGTDNRATRHTFKSP